MYDYPNIRVNSIDSILIIIFNFEIINLNCTYILNLS